MPPESSTFLIVTPAFNSAAFIDETILSVVSQHGPFLIRFHVQDGGSTDSTIQKLESWKSLLDAGSFPIQCSSVEFTFHSAADRGMYDAINRGFQTLGVRASDYLTYINSDDRLMPGALQYASGRFGESDALAWLGGRPCEINEAGEMMRIHQEQVYPTASLRAGLHDGRHMRFVMQEGTFWRGRLWQAAGEFRTDLRQAGDWDLWRRFANHAPYVTTDMTLACHRRSAKQLTADMGAYHREVDTIIGQELTDLHAAELERFRQWCRRPEEQADRRFFGTLFRFRMTSAGAGSGTWEAEERAYSGPLGPTVSNGLTSRMLPAHFDTGFGPENSGNALVNLVAGFRTATSSQGTLHFDARRNSLHRIFLRCRSFESGTRLRLTHSARTILNVELPVTCHGWEALVTSEAVFQIGPNHLSLEIIGKNPLEPPLFLVTSCEAASTV
jgi:hypothetical protein